MDSHRAHFIAAHIATSQRHVETALRAADVAVQHWRSQPTHTAAHEQAGLAVEQLQAAVEQHFSRVAGEGLVEDVVNEHPDLYPQLRELEQWQSQLVDSAGKIAEQMRQAPGSQEDAAAVEQALKAFRSELLKEEREERDIVDRGLSESP